MNSKQQEADRVRMERALLRAGMDAKRALDEAFRATKYDERLRAWEALSGATCRARDMLWWYMSDYGLFSEGVDE